MPNAERATRQSWPNIKPLPAQHSGLTIQRTFTEQEYEKILLGFVPEQMEDKWFMFVEDDALYAHRSWTGYCIYQLVLVKDEGGYVAGETFVNRDEIQYSGKDDLYDGRMLMFLIDHLLLGVNYPMPMSATVSAGIETELHYQHVLGAGQKAEPQTINITMRGMFGWLWQWLRWLVRR
jgi:8-oxo-dGTP diphosphatase